MPNFLVKSCYASSMTSDLIREGGELVSDVAAAAGAASGAEPTSGSVMAEEMARDSVLGDANLPYPFGFTHTMHRALLYAASERLMTLSWCLSSDPYPHVASASELARAAAEAASTAWWLTDQEADGERRLHRMLGLLEVSNKEESRLQRDLGLPVKDGGTQLSLKWGRNVGLTIESPPSRTELLQRCSPTGGVDYRRLSAVAHSTAYALFAIWLEVQEAQEANNVEPIRLHALMSAAVAARYVIIGIHGASRAAGVDRGQWKEVTHRAEDFEARVVSAASALSGQAP
ncbi:MAG TPA: hypothetical protein VGR26_13655 [Acidimicrobiales bacterium]|nr:hypothetical protein [Acidimicrobiales bacterium]